MSGAAAAAVAPARRGWRPLAVPDLAAAAEGVILFDGVCVFCSRWVAFVLARDAAGEFRFATVQSRFGRVLAARLGIDAEAPETNAVILGGRAFFKSDAAIAVLRHLPGWRWVPVLRLVPRVLRDRLYDLIARNRYAWFGRTELCMVPTPALARRIVPDGSEAGG